MLSMPTWNRGTAPGGRASASAYGHASKSWNEAAATNGPPFSHRSWFTCRPTDHGPPTHARILPVRGRERASDHEAVRAARDPVFVLAFAREGLRRGSVRLDISIAQRLVHATRRRDSGGAGHLF